VYKLRKLIVDRRRPLPATVKRIVPWPIIYWNHGKGMTDVFSRCMKNVKPVFNSLHPYAFIWIRMIMTMMWNAHLLHRLFKIERELPRFTSLEQLRNKLNKESSFQGSIGIAAMTYKIVSASGRNVLLIHNDAEAAADNNVDSEVSTTLESLKESCRNSTKLEYLNSKEGYERRTQKLHLQVSSSSKRRCIFCDKKTSYYCATCSTTNVTFYMCKTQSYTEHGRKLAASCFVRCHEMKKIVPDKSRRKSSSEAMLQRNRLAASKSAESRKRRRSNTDDTDATEDREDSNEENNDSGDNLFDMAGPTQPYNGEHDDDDGGSQFPCMMSV
jgi:hypothetical protein